ncbi:alpha-L-fucosidase [Humibacter sp.]|jgi:alpha-L-fucosidase|uniref:alpha-L-fucosidase n=1 Tax=Humibacter sp. TaxID=1940291 RepID=UPI002CAE9048|nr:alpha-L-fucosidase [Humibacter sp.]HVX08007.1 alpha-L-fucosidase [Humibacter sp.]
MTLEPLDPSTLPAPVDVSDNREALAMVDSVIADGPYDATWESLSRYRVPQWYRDAKFGIFLHWGAFSVPAFGNEWYPRTMYRRGTPTFEHHVQTYGPHDRFGYKDFLPHFRMERFDPQEWVALFKRAGAQFVVPVAEHHDGYTMYDTARSRWKVTEIGPQRDVMGDLLAEVDRSWLVAGASTHRAEHWFFMNRGLEFDSDVRDPAYADLYGPALRKEMTPTERFLEDWLLRTVEIIDSYRPQILYFDTGIEEPSFEPYIRRLAAYYYNRAAEWGREVVINYKWESFAPGSAVLDVERGTMSGIRSDVWQNDTSVSRTSWSWVEGHDYKDATELVQELVDVVSKNGNLLLNIGPRPDGTIPEEEVALLEAVGEWLAVHGEAIYGSTPWAVFGEGPTSPSGGSFTDAVAPVYTEEDIRFTTMLEVGHRYVYAIGLVRPEDGRMRIRSFGSGSRLLDRPIVDVRVLGSSETPEWERTESHLEVVLPEQETRGTAGAVVRIELEPAAPEKRIDFFHGLGI